MTTAKKRTEPATCEKSLTLKIAELETAIETIAAYIGYLTNEVIKEEAEPQPCAERIQAMEEQIEVLLNEREDLRPDNYTLINKAMYIYGPIMKAFYWTK